MLRFLWIRNRAFSPFSELLIGQADIYREKEDSESVAGLVAIMID